MIQTVKFKCREYAANNEQNSQPKKVLLVDDNRVNRLVAEQLLLLWGYEVCVAGDGLAALKLLARDHFDVILMNLNMPGMNGRETTRLIRRVSKHYQSAPIVALSSSGEQFLKAREPFTDFLEVPYVPEQLKNMLELHLAQPAKPSESSPKIEERLESISGGDEVYRRELISLFIKNCAEILEDLQMGRLESPAYLGQVRHKHRSSLRLLALTSLEVALDNLQEALQDKKYDQLVLQYRKQAVEQQTCAVLSALDLLLAPVG